MQAGADLRFLVAALRAAYEPAAQLQLENPAFNPDWAGFIKLAQRHRVEGLAWDGLCAGGIRIPSDASDLLRDSAQRIAARNLDRLMASSRVSASFQEGGIDHLFLKGLALGALAFPRPHAKDCCDIDLLVAPDQLGDAGRRLHALGYRLIEPRDMGSLEQWHQRRKESVWVDVASNCQIDLHTRLADNPGLIAGIGLRSPRQKIPIDGVTLETLADAPLYAYLCVHGASSAWFRLKWLADLHGFMLARSGGHFEAWLDYATAHGAERASALAAMQLRRWFDFAHPAGRPGQPAAATMIRLLDRIATRQVTSLQEPTQRPLGTLGIHLTQALAKPGLGFAVRDMTRQAVDILTRA